MSRATLAQFRSHFNIRAHCSCLTQAAIPSLDQKETAHQAVRIPTRHPPADTRDLVEFTAKPKTEAKPGASGEAGLEIGMQSVENDAAPRTGLERVRFHDL